MTALEWGLFEYAEAVMDNYLTHFMKHDGTILYRGLEMAQQGRILTCISLYYQYTRDDTLLLKHLDKIDGAATLLHKRRELSLSAWPTTDSRYGMPTGIDETDMWWASTANNGTEVAFVSIATEMWRGFVEMGVVLAEIANTTSAGPSTVAVLNNISSRMLHVAPLLLQAIQRSMATDVIPAATRNTPRCFPYVAGIRDCGELPPSVPTSRGSEAWRTYSEMFGSGALEPAIITEILHWHQTQQGSGVNGSRLKLGVLAGAGNTVANGDQLETFTIHGFGYGLLSADLVEPFLLQYFALSAHAYTRGTWIAPESSYIDRNLVSPSFCAPAGLVAPLNMKYMLLFEEPVSHTLWVGKALPRLWLTQNQRVSVSDAPTAYGRVAFEYISSISALGSVSIGVLWPTHSGRTPKGGIRVRVRVPLLGSRQIQPIRSVRLADGRAWNGFNVSEESLVFTSSDLASGMGSLLRNITVSY